MHQPFIHMMQRSGDRNSCGYAGGPEPFPGIINEKRSRILPLLKPNRLKAWPIDDLETAAAQALHKLFALEG
jgi:hypothetical protein